MTVTWTSGPDTVTTEVSTDGTTWETVTAGTSYELNGLDDDSYTVYVRVTDLAGNVNQTQVSFVVDTIGPTATLSPTGSGVTVNTEISVTFSETMNRTSVSITLGSVTETVTRSDDTATFTSSILSW